MTDKLLLHHELLLLALADDSGKVAFGDMLTIGLGGALLTELLLAERIAVVRDTTGLKRSWVEVRDRTPLGDALLDNALEQLATAKRRVQMSTAVTRLGGRRRLRHDVALALCARGILREDEQRILALFRRKVYPTVNPKPEQALVRRIRDVLDGGKTPDARTAALIGIAGLTNTLRAIYDRKTLRALKPRLKALAESHAGSRAAKEAVAAVHAAIMAATIAATAAAAS
jgi:golgi phosphoprotein 3